MPVRLLLGPQTGVTNQRRYVIYRSVSFALLKVIKYDIRLGEFARCADVGKAMQCTHTHNTRISGVWVCALHFPLHLASTNTERRRDRITARSFAAVIEYCARWL